MDKNTTKEKDVTTPGLADEIEGISDDMRIMVNKMGGKTKVLLSAHMLPPMELIMLAQVIMGLAKDNNISELAKIDTHLDIGLSVLAGKDESFPFEMCSDCKNFLNCQEAMEGVEPLTEEVAEKLMTANATGIVGEA